MKVTIFVLEDKWHFWLNGINSIFQQNVDILKDPETVKQLGSILKTNVRACKAVGHPFVIQLGRIYLDMLNVYKCLSENISAAIQANGKKFHVFLNGIGSACHQVSNLLQLGLSYCVYIGGVCLS